MLHISFPIKGPLSQDVHTYKRVYDFFLNSSFVILAHFLNAFMNKVTNPHQSFPWIPNAVWAKQLVSDINTGPLLMAL